MESSSNGGKNMSVDRGKEVGEREKKNQRQVTDEMPSQNRQSKVQTRETVPSRLCR